MSKYFLIVFIIIGFSLKSEAQNLVPNGGFEIQEECSSWQSLLNSGSAPPWNIPNIASADLYNWDCIEAGKINNGIGSAGIIMYHLNDYREYLQTPFATNLVQGKQYCVELYIATMGFEATDDLGVYFSPIELSEGDFAVLDEYSPQLENENGNWLLDYDFQSISWEYIANGTEAYMIIGNFKDNVNTDLYEAEGIEYPYCYYYFDDISVEECADTSSTHLMDYLPKKLDIYPNPSTGNFKIIMPANLSVNHTIQLHNSVGKRMPINYVQSGNIIEFFTSKLIGGIYILNLTTDKQNYRDKIVIE